MSSLQKARFAVFAYFAIAGSAVTVWAVHIPDVEERLNLTHSQIGMAILMIGIGALLSMQVVGSMVDKMGSKRSLLLITPALGLATFLPGLAGEFFGLLAAMLVFGLFVGGIDIAMNAAALEVERLYERPIFSAFHGFWSIGCVLGSAVGSFALGFDSPMLVTMGAWGTISLLVGIALNGWLVTDEKHAAKEVVTSPAPSNRRHLPFVIFVGLVSAAGALTEGVGIDWSALFSVKQFHVTAGVAAITVTVFSSAMAAMRFFADKVVERYGRLFVIRWGSAVAGLGILAAITSPALEISLFGWALAGLGIAGVVPQCMAFGSEIGAREHQGRNLAKVVGITYAGVLGGPAAIGFIAQATTIQISLIAGVVLATFVALSTIIMSKKRSPNAETV